MNKIYRSVWNEASGCWVAVQENAKGRSKSDKSRKSLNTPAVGENAEGTESGAGPRLPLAIAAAMSVAMGGWSGSAFALAGGGVEACQSGTSSGTTIVSDQ